MNTVVRTALAVVVIALPAVAGPRPSMPDRTEATSSVRETGAPERNVLTAPAPENPTRALEQRVRALESELARAQAEQLERPPVLGASDLSSVGP